MNLIFYGSDYYSTLVLKKLLSESSIKIVGIVTGANDPSLPFKFTPVWQLGEQHNISVKRVDSKADILAIKEWLESLHSNIALVASFGFIIPQTIFELPHLGTLNIHPSALPAYRGPSPAQQTILDGKHETAVSIIRLTNKMDAGDIIDQVKLPVDPNDTTMSLLTTSFELGAERFIHLIQLHPNNDFPFNQQDDTAATFTHTFTTNDAQINWDSDDEHIFNHIRAFYPKPIAWTFVADLVRRFSDKKPSPKWEDLKVKIHRAIIHDGKVVPAEIQIEGKALMAWDSFVRGYLS